MTARPILLWPDPCLKQVAAPVSDITDEVRAIWTDMIDTMEAMPGVGLAAPQIGISLRLAVVDASDDRGWAVRLANPVLIEASDEMHAHPEASPCLPGVHAKLSRPSRVIVRYLDETGVETERAFEGLWATSVQHQIDHLDGRLFVERLSRTKRDMLMRKYRKGAR